MLPPSTIMSGSMIAVSDRRPKAKSLADDRRRTAEKLAEADFAITQFFFDAHHYFDLVTTLHDLGVDWVYLSPILDGINGIGPSASAKILAERKKGDFKDWADFTARVKGIKDSKAKKLSAAGLTVNGAAYKGEAPAAVDIKSKIEENKARAKAKDEKNGEVAKK